MLRSHLRAVDVDNQVEAVAGALVPAGMRERTVKPPARTGLHRHHFRLALLATGKAAIEITLEHDMIALPVRFRVVMATACRTDVAVRVDLRARHAPGQQDAP